MVGMSITDQSVNRAMLMVRLHMHRMPRMHSKYFRAALVVTSVGIRMYKL